MKVAIMQPYFFPYIGYFQLINAVDKFVLYDDIEYTKKGWINRNRILVNGADAYISLPLSNASDFLPVKERYLANTWETEKKKMLNRIKETYRKAPFFKETYALIEACLEFKNTNLFDFIFNSLSESLKFLNIQTPIIISSTIPLNPELKSDHKVIEICKLTNATHYINPIGGIPLYSKESFEQHGLQLSFLQSEGIQYAQFNHSFVPWLSIIDVMMFNSVNDIKVFYCNYRLQ
jgi:hypothetical protein